MKYKYSKSWKELIISCSVVSILFLVLHSAIAIGIMSSGNIYLYRAIAPCHVVWIPSTVLFVKNYRHLVSTKIMTKSTGRFWAGLAVIFGCEIINIVLLVFTIMQG